MQQCVDANNGEKGEPKNKENDTNCWKRPCSAHCFHLMAIEVGNWSETVLKLFCTHLIFPVVLFLTSLYPH